MSDQTVSILAVIVLFKISPKESASVTSLAHSLASTDASRLRLRVVLFDNSPREQPAPRLFPDEAYLWAQSNSGLAHAYNSGLAMAQNHGFDWFLTLDQDTSLPEDFLSGLVDVISKVGGDPEIAAVVPQIRESERALSPYTFRWGVVPAWFPVGYMGASEDATYALNSASLLRVSALRQVGGYDSRFWLDASDHSMFHSLAAHGKKVYVAGNLQVQHQLSVLSQNSMSLARYENMIAAESAFWDLRMSRLANWERNARLIVRFLRQLRHKQTELGGALLKHIQRRILRSRRHRLRLWERTTESFLRNDQFNRVPPPKISVCMAAYNGERYIQEQIASILPQLQKEDELIVVDDASSDHTRERILAIADPRICLIAQSKNRGVVKTFEHAVRSATGDILFLSDGDDIWAPDKVQKVLKAFVENPRAELVSTGLRLIDENGQPLDTADYMKKREFTASFLPNLLRNRFQGSVMALRSSLLFRILPFPGHCLFLHDAWIGMCTILMGGDVVYLDEPLLSYRRHSNNVSNRMGRIQQIRSRVQLLANLMVRWLQHR